MNIFTSAVVFFFFVSPNYHKFWSASPFRKRIEKPWYQFRWHIGINGVIKEQSDKRHQLRQIIQVYSAADNDILTRIVHIFLYSGKPYTCSTISWASPSQHLPQNCTETSLQPRWSIHQQNFRIGLCLKTSPAIQLSIIREMIYTFIFAASLKRVQNHIKSRKGKTRAEKGYSGTDQWKRKPRNDDENAHSEWQNFHTTEGGKLSKTYSIIMQHKRVSTN